MSQTPGSSAREGNNADSTPKVAKDAPANPTPPPVPVVAKAPAPAKPTDGATPIASDFYNVADAQGRLTAGLLVLLDSKRRPVRAELHLGGSTTEESGREAIRQAQHILEERYTGPESLPLQVWQSFLRSEPLHVPLPPAGAGQAATRSGPAASASDEGGGLPWRMIATIAGAVLIVALLWWIVSSLRGGSTPAATEPSSGGLTVPVTDGASGDGDLTGDLPPAPGDINIVSGDPPLPPSINAPAEILPGRRVRMVPGLTQSVLDRPGTNEGSEIARLEADTSVMVVGGPEELPGQSDTIVWFEVDMGGGITGWVAANNSTQALLEVAD